MPRMLSDDQARQGPTGRPVLGVLIGALLLCAVAVACYMVWVGMSSPDDASQASSRQSVTGSASGSGLNPTSQTPPGNPSYPSQVDPSATGTTQQLQH